MQKIVQITMAASLALFAWPSTTTNPFSAAPIFSFPSAASASSASSAASHSYKLSEFWKQSSSFFISNFQIVVVMFMTCAVAISVLTSKKVPSYLVSMSKLPSHAGKLSTSLTCKGVASMVVRLTYYKSAINTSKLSFMFRKLCGLGFFRHAGFRRCIFIHLDFFKCVQTTAGACIAFALTCDSAAADFLVTVDPINGINSIGCGLTAPCKTISFAILQNNMSVSSVALTAGHFNESSVIISSFASLSISGVPSATFFDCSRMLASGAAFEIVNSTVAFTDITFVNCSNVNSNGGAVSARSSSLNITRCSFINCSAASGGAISVAGHGNAFLNVQNSSFFRNFANGGLSGCPSTSTEPCSTWGGAIAAFEVFDVSISGCTMVANSARAYVPRVSLQQNASRNALAGGGCISVLFVGNASGSSARFINNQFKQCTVKVSSSENVDLGNGEITHCV